MCSFLSNGFLARLQSLKYKLGRSMKTITIQTMSGEDPAYDVTEKRIGKIEAEGLPFPLYTIEKPFIPNPDAPDQIGGGVPYKSAVPLGEYDLVLRDSPRHGEQWHFVNPDLHVYLEKDDREEDWERFSTMFHVANTASNVVGCIGVGAHVHDFGAVHGLGVSSSALGIHTLKEYLKGETKAKLIIV